MIAHYCSILMEDTEWIIFFRNVPRLQTCFHRNFNWQKRKNQGTFRDVDILETTEYAAEDADITFNCTNFCNSTQKENLEDLFYKIEMPLMKVLAKMELAGSFLDENWLKQKSKDLENDLKISKKIF